VCELDDLSSGPEWLSDGCLLIVSGQKHQLVTFDAKTKALHVYADISRVTAVQVNGMVVDAAGRAYTSNFGFDHKRPFRCKSATLVRVDTDHNVTVESTKMMFPNGAVITPDGKTLIIAETLSGFLTAFDVANDGVLSNWRVEPTSDCRPRHRDRCRGLRVGGNPARRPLQRGRRSGAHA
jgi:sugar lactone lactonase YvrE